MNITIIHQEGCPLGEVAIREFTEDGHHIETYRDLIEIADPDRKNSMMTDLLHAGGDKDACPNVFIEDRYIPWRPKESPSSPGVAQ